MKQEFSFQTVLKELPLEDMLARIEKVRLAVLGDLCLDVYWHADMTRSELSRETPHFPLPVTREIFSLGGAANVCANAAAMGVASVTALGVVGDDWRGMVLRRCCEDQHIHTGALVEVPGRMTNAYCKPIRHGISDVAYEDPRLDFCDSRPQDKAAEEKLLEQLKKLDADVLCVSDQLKDGCITPAIREQVLKLSRDGMLVVADSRDRIQLYPGAVCKPNEVEGYMAVHGCRPPKDVTMEDFARCASQLSAMTGRDVFMTLGSQGCLHACDGALSHVSAAAAPEQIDFVGAGDTMLAALSAGLAAGAAPVAAMTFANLCASVTIGKIGTTGTASPEEIRRAAQLQ